MLGHYEASCMHQRRRAEGSVAHCGPAKSLLLGPGAELLNQKRGIRGLLKVFPLKQIICILHGALERVQDTRV